MAPGDEPGDGELGAEALTEEALVEALAEALAEAALTEALTEALVAAGAGALASKLELVSKPAMLQPQLLELAGEGPASGVGTDGSAGKAGGKAAPTPVDLGRPWWLVRLSCRCCVLSM